MVDSASILAEHNELARIYEVLELYSGESSGCIPLPYPPFIDAPKWVKMVSMILGFKPKAFYVPIIIVRWELLFLFFRNGGRGESCGEVARCSSGAIVDGWTKSPLCRVQAHYRSTAHCLACHIGDFAQRKELHHSWSSTSSSDTAKGWNFKPVSRGHPAFGKSNRHSRWGWSLPIENVSCYYLVGLGAKNGGVESMSYHRFGLAGVEITIAIRRKWMERRQNINCRLRRRTPKPRHWQKRFSHQWIRCVSVYRSITPSFSSK